MCRLPYTSTQTHGINGVAEMTQVLNLDEDMRRALSAYGEFRLLKSHNISEFAAFMRALVYADKHKNPEVQQVDRGMEYIKADAVERAIDSVA